MLRAACHTSAALFCSIWCRSGGMRPRVGQHLTRLAPSTKVSMCAPRPTPKLTPCAVLLPCALPVHICRNIEWDAVEAPSQMQEKWVYDKDTFNSFAKHWQTNQPVPEDLFARIKAMRTYRKGEAPGRGGWACRVGWRQCVGVGACMIHLCSSQLLLLPEWAHAC